ncbi:hypothetical protein, partial [Stutzerimonas stutzeri]|uniref:hypothetical protein n=1 Tax=Stutzerimonas stutzeri TaxID=316 RepID=UPI00195543F4
MNPKEALRRFFFLDTYAADPTSASCIQFICHETAISIVHRGMADRHPYDGIAKDASVVYRESAAPSTRHRNRANPLER